MQPMQRGILTFVLINQQQLIDLKEIFGVHSHHSQEMKLMNYEI
jgi:hypothetical protein